MLSSLGDHRWATAAATQDLSQMLVVGDKIDEDLEAKKRELTFLKDEVRGAFFSQTLWNASSSILS